MVISLLAVVMLGFLWDGSPLGTSAIAQAVRFKFPELRKVTPSELVAWMADPNRPPPLLVDARPKSQYDMSHLDGALWIDPAAPDLAVLENVRRDNPLVVYDAAGIVGAAMAQALTDAGFQRVSSLQGGIFAWANEGWKLVDANGPATKVDPVSWGWGRLLKARYRP